MLPLFTLVFTLTFCQIWSVDPEADISFMIADLKVSEARGIKVCEIQPGLLSTFKGDRFSHGGVGTISHQFIKQITRFQKTFFSTPTTICDDEILELLTKLPEAHFKKSFTELKHEKNFRKLASLVTKNRQDLTSYQGMLMIRSSHIKDITSFKQKNPGLLVMDGGTYSFWRDKFKMSELFRADPLLETLKPVWKQYEKKYSPQLTAQIIQDIPSSYYVIKPRDACLGRGVIIVSRDELDKTLRTILVKTSELKNNPDKSYNHWYKDPFDNFLVEEFVSSDPIFVPHLNGTYQPTMRVAFLLIYHQGSYSVKFLGGYCSLPTHSLEEGGTLNEAHKSYCKLPYYEVIEPGLLKQIEDQLEPILPHLHRKMLESN